MLTKRIWIWNFLLLFSVAWPQKTPVDSIDIYIANEDYVRAIPLVRTWSSRYLAERDYTQYQTVIQRKIEIHRALNDHNKLLAVAFDALRKMENHGNEEGVVMLTKEIGETYLDLANFRRAKTYFRRGHNRAQQLQSDSLIKMMSQALCKAYFDTRHDSVVYFMDEIKRLTPSNASAEAKYTMYNNYLSYYSAREELDKAKMYLDSTLHYALRTDEPSMKARALSNAGALSIINEEYGKATRYYEEIFSFYRDTTSLLASDIYKNYSWALYGLGRYKESLDYFEKATDIRDRIHTENSNRAIGNLEKKYELDKLEQKYLDKQREQTLLAGRHQKMFIIVVCLLGFLLILLYFYFQNNSLRQQNHLQELQTKQQQNLIAATLDGREIERKNIARVLHDNVSALLSSAGLQLMAFNATRAQPSDEIQKARDILKTAHQQVRDLSHDLMPTMLAKFGLGEAIRDLTDKMSTPQQPVTADLSQWACTRYSEDFELKVYFMVSELLNNATKHANASEVAVTLKQMESGLKITVADNGKGLGSSSEGFGLNQIRARVSNMGGTMDITSPKKGTQISIDLPYPV